MMLFNVQLMQVQNVLSLVSFDCGIVTPFDPSVVCVSLPVKGKFTLLWPPWPPNISVSILHKITTIHVLLCSYNLLQKVFSLGAFKGRRGALCISELGFFFSVRASIWLVKVIFD